MFNWIKKFFKKEEWTFKGQPPEVILHKEYDNYRHKRTDHYIEQCPNCFSGTQKVYHDLKQIKFNNVEVFQQYMVIVEYCPNGCGWNVDFA